MDFNPLDILAAAALGEKDAPSDVKSSKSGQAGSSGQSETSESADGKDADDESNQEMGKTTSNGLKHKHCAKDTCEKAMAPQKMPWSPETLMPNHLDGIDGRKEKFSLDELVEDIKKKGLDVQLKKMLDNSISKDMDLPLHVDEDVLAVKETHQEQTNNNVILVKNAINTRPETKCNPPDSTLETDNKDEMAVTLEGKENTALTDEASFNPSDGESSDIKSPDDADSPAEITASELITMDHSYALGPGQTRIPPSQDDDDDDVDVCSDNSPLPEETEQRSRNLSVDCNYLKYGILEGVSASTYDLYKMSTSDLGRSKLPSSSSSTSSPTADIVSKPTPAAGSDDNGDFLSGPGSPQSSSAPSTSGQSPVRPAPKYGKFKIGTFASFSSSNLELEKYLKSKDHANNRKLNIGIPPETHLINSSLSSPSAYPSVHPLLQSPSLDWDRSEAGSETQDDSSDARTPHRLSPDFITEKVTEWSHPMYHDHDYCAKETGTPTISDDLTKLTTGKRKYTKRKNKLDGLNHEKIMKAKYLKKELLRQDSFMKTASEPEVSTSDSVVIKSNPVGRPRKRPMEKIMDEEIDPETGTKLKITGKFQDQYVYYLSKSSRTTTRRRQTPSLPSSSDKIIVPAPKPGDIVVPHLTDADIETVRLKGRSALNLPERPHMTNACTMPQSLPATSTIPMSIPTSHHSTELISDVDSHIVSTILSMESDNLASPTTSQAPHDITSTAGLNPNQPALTESLRLMSGDPSITSEHVLNYLLSVVKDGLVDSSSSFPSLPSDGIYTKADHMAQPGISTLETSVPNPNSSALGHVDFGKSVQSTSALSNTTVLSTAHGPESDHYIHTPNKDAMDENVSLPDDLSSFISNSQGTSSSNMTHDGDSHSSLKSMFGSDLSSLGTPQLSASVPRLTSIEKTLDYLGVRDDDIKLDSNVFSSKVDHDLESTQALTLVSTSSADDTPWIVTVTLYFNDVPAIMINNQPYIRLVDIHKQILPAKDTGILKKRCQLLKIPVLNCSEMQRYFLVQYGRAYNSKSTLIVSKDQATNLVTYYATPQPRIGRTDEAHQRRPSSSGGSEGSTRSPVTTVPLGGSKKRGGKNQRKVAASSGVPEPQSSALALQLQEKTTVQEPDEALSHNKRTRHKKVNYLEMLKGEEREKSSDAAILETIESVVKSAPDFLPDGKSAQKMPFKKKVKGDTSCDKTNNTSKKKVSNLQSKKPNEKGPRGKKDSMGAAVQRVKGSKVTVGGGDKAGLEPDVNMSSEVDSDDSTDVTQSKKFRPLKLKVNSLLNFSRQRKGSSPTKKGLFSRSNSVSSPTSDRPLRVLAVAHQAAISSNNAESRLPSQPAHIHLDLFVKSTSACVRCETCSQFLSVPHFMRHHHVPMDSEWLATEAAHRILVPRNKENISEQEKQLWEEFHRLQEAIGGFGEADDDTDTDGDGHDYEEEDDDEDEDDDDDNSFDHSSLELSGASSSMLSLERSPLGSEAADKELNLMNSATEGDLPSSVAGDEESDDSMDSDEPSPDVHPAKDVTPKLSNEALAKIGLVRRETEERTTINSGLLNGVRNTPMASSVRTSSRKRKSKQLFSIENYYTPKKSVNEEESASRSAHSGDVSVYSK